MAYSVTLTRSAQKNFDALPHIVQPRVAEALRKMADEPRSLHTRKLEGRAGYRVSVGDYRILYLIDDETEVATVYRIGHRRDVYRGN